MRDVRRERRAATSAGFGLPSVMVTKATTVFGEPGGCLFGFAEAGLHTSTAKAATVAHRVKRPGLQIPTRRL